MDYLKSITPPKEKLELFLMILRKDFNQSVMAINTKRTQAEQQITEIRELRETLVIKNLKDLLL